MRAQIREKNDGTQPLEAWQRVSQVIFERWLKEICEKNPLIDLRYGWKVESVQELGDRVKVSAQKVESREPASIMVDYVAGCDGASSNVRQSLELPIDGGPVSSCVLLVHFKSRDLTRLHKQGQFWHIFFLQGAGLFSGAVIAQDEVDTWTTHMFLPLDADETQLDSHEAIYRTLGGSHQPYEIKIDEILVRSVWRPNIAVARQWAGASKRVFIAGDAAHQLIPTGGYGMNTGVGDAYDLAWKLSAVINGYAGKGLLDSYETERRPVAMRNSEHSGVHMTAHITACSLLAGNDLAEANSDTETGKEIRSKVHEHYQNHIGENTDLGIEMGYRYQSSVIIPESDGASEPPWTPSAYVPTTWPGSRPPHLFLENGKAIFDELHPSAWTLVTFNDQPCGEEYIIQAAQNSKVPMKHLNLSGESKAKELWERDLVLIRPDEHVAWRGQSVSSLDAAKNILATVTGNHAPKEDSKPSSAPVDVVKGPSKAFTATTGLATQTNTFHFEKISEFQR
ncbi:uncharacterized protein A1O5_04335 [Cladophialophora psammophila CBS 110553]|uniref:FAD-binding domain-containing protein n=1 Tax=Cladophialophora psammophila CBS 110553 TaxID=1182543 RepID=W9XND3_9EURO|nr:uncharacterized protein A1O5_04335 [Cladophialophora psammophila CBS 110553]EXJ71834.1 hypothetical protein A1O5_04335 [Cladophialophora psammophila CBS 110553]